MSKKTDIMAALTPYVESVTKDLTIGETIIPIKIKPLIRSALWIRLSLVGRIIQGKLQADIRNIRNFIMKRLQR